MPKTFKVMDACLRSSWVPHIRFRAAWLKTAGFDIGDTFTVENPEPGLLTLRVNEPQLTTKDFDALISRFEQAGIK